MWLLLLAGVFWVAPGIAVAIHAAMQKSEPRSALLWLFSACLFPVIGPLLYLLIGINRIHRRTVRRLGVRERPFSVPRSGSGSGAEGLGEDPPLAGLRRVVDGITRLPLLAGNRVTPLEGGEEAYPAMLGAIRGAERSITLVSYIFDLDPIGEQFVKALIEARSRGVGVHVLLDGVGALGSIRRVTRMLRRGGVEVEAFFPLTFPVGRFRVNLRNHRKILVVDGAVGFTGGMNISRRHLLWRRNAETSDDLHFRLEGPVVRELQHTNDEDWTLATDRAFPDDDRYYPKLEAVGQSWCRVISGGPDQDERTISRVVQAACASAQSCITIVTPYFLPTEAIVSHLIMARLRGVGVRILIPDRTDVALVRWATDSMLPVLLRYGVEIRSAPPPFLHAKVMLADDQWGFIGSANIDPRSLRLSFECNVEVWDPAFHAVMADWFGRRWERSAPVTIDQLEARPFGQRLRSGVARLFTPML